MKFLIVAFNILLAATAAAGSAQRAPHKSRPTEQKNQPKLTINTKQLFFRYRSGTTLESLEQRNERLFLGPKAKFRTIVRSSGRVKNDHNSSDSDSNGATESRGEKKKKRKTKSSTKRLRGASGKTKQDYYHFDFPDIECWEQLDLCSLEYYYVFDGRNKKGEIPGEQFLQHAEENGAQESEENVVQFPLCPAFRFSDDGNNRDEVVTLEQDCLVQALESDNEFIFVDAPESNEKLLSAYWGSSASSSAEFSGEEEEEEKASSLAATEKTDRVLQQQADDDNNPSITAANSHHNQHKPSSSGGLVPDTLFHLLSIYMTVTITRS